MYTRFSTYLIFDFIIILIFNGEYKLFSLILSYVLQIPLISKYSHNVLWRSLIFWVMMPCSLSKFHLYFRGTFCLHLQDWKVSYLLFCAWLTLQPCQWRHYVSPKTYTEAQGIRTDKIMAFAGITVKTSKVKNNFRSTYIYINVDYQELSRLPVIK
jgi:hypothetical protein